LSTAAAWTHVLRSSDQWLVVSKRLGARFLVGCVKDAERKGLQLRLGAFAFGLHADASRWSAKVGAARKASGFGWGPFFRTFALWQKIGAP
jgi:hypothetical protein